MPNSFQWITLLLIENIYFAGTKVKSPHTLAWTEAKKKKKPLVLWKYEPKPKKPLVLWKHEPRSKNPRSLKTWAKIQNLWSSENMSQSPKILGLRKHEPESRALVFWKHEPRSKILGPWKHEPGSRTFGSLKTWAKAQKTLGPLKT